MVLGLNGLDINRTGTEFCVRGVKQRSGIHIRYTYHEAKMMTSDNYSTPRKYKVEPSDGHLFQKDGERKDTKSYIDDHTATASHSTDLCGAESADIGSPSSSNGRKARGRRSKDHVVDDATPISDDTPLAGATAQVTEKPKSLKKEKPIGSSSKKRKERKNLREKRRSTGVVIMPGADVSTNVC